MISWSQAVFGDDMIRDRVHCTAMIEVCGSEKDFRILSQSFERFSSFGGRTLTPEVTTIVAAISVFLMFGIPASPRILLHIVRVGDIALQVGSFYIPGVLQDPHDAA